MNNHLYGHMQRISNLGYTTFQVFQLVKVFQSILRKEHIWEHFYFTFLGPFLGPLSQSSIKCCHAVTAWRAEQGSCEPVSELRVRSREREIGSQRFCSQLEAREEYKREIGSQSFCSQLEAREECKSDIGSKSSWSQLKVRKKYK